MPRFSQATIVETHQVWRDLTSEWTIDVADNSLWFYILRHGIAHMLICGEAAAARARLADVLFSGRYLGWCYELLNDDFSPMLKMWNVLGHEYARSSYANAIPQIKVTNNNHFLFIRYVVEFIRDAGWIDEAVAIAEIAQEKHLLHLGEEHAETAESRMQWALALKAAKKNDQAIPIAMKALAVQRRCLSPDNPLLYVSINSLASMLNAAKRYPEARLLFFEAIDNRTRLLGKEHPKTLISIASLAHMLNKMNLLEEAEPLHRRAHRGRRSILGPLHPKTLGSCINLGICLMGLGKLQEAEECFQECVEGRLEILGAEHPKTKNAMRKLATCQEKQTFS